MNLLAQTTTVPWPTWDGTVLGLLFVVLVAVGAGIRWFAIKQLETFKAEQREARDLFATEQKEARATFAEAIKGERTVWLDQLTKEQQRSERVISGLAEDFKEAVAEFKQVATKGNL